MACMLGAMVAACAREAADETPVLDAPPARDTTDVASSASLPECATLAETLLRTPATRSALAAAYGAPDSVRATTEPNRHIQGATDSLFAVYYPGLAVMLRTPPAARDLVSHVSVTDDRYLAHRRIGIGATEKAVIATLGEPHDRAEAGETTSLTYACGVAVEQPVTFHLRDDAVVRIEASYYVD